MATITTAVAILKLGDILTKWFIEAYSGRGEKLDERKIKREFNESLGEARKALEDCLPQKSDVAYSTILGEFFSSKILELQCWNLLENGEYDTKSLAEVFNEAYSRHYSGKAQDFSPLPAIQAFFDKFIQSASRNDRYVKVENFRLWRQNLRRGYCEQLTVRHENLDFTGVPKKERDMVKLEEIFIPLQAYRRIPEVDILIDDLQSLPPTVRKPPIRKISRQETVSLMEEIEDSQKVVVLGMPGSGKTTFMRYLALSAAQKLSKEPRKLGKYRLPILISVRDIADDVLSKKPIASLLGEYVNAELQDDLPTGYFLPYLEAGCCMVLFDGLDEVPDAIQRGEIVKRALQFVNKYQENKYVITSRIAGYREIQGIPEERFTHFTVRDFDDDQIKDFAKKWYESRNPSQAEAEAKNLVDAIEMNPKVRQLAANPLMLTIIAIVHESNTRLPNRRIELYDECTKTLLFTWRERRKSPPLIDVHGMPISDVEVRRRLEQLADWMHEQTSAKSQQLAYVKRTLLKNVMAEQLAERKKMEQDDAEAEAESFLEYIREHTGILLERGTQLYAFVHLTFQEYFAAWEICRYCGKDADKAWERIHDHLHDSHWREVILLMIAKLDEQYPDEIGEELIQKILEAESPYEDLLRRDLLLAGACLADDVTAEAGTSKKIIDEIIELAIHSSYSVQKEFAADVMRDLLNSQHKDYVAGEFLKLLSDEDSDVRGNVAYALVSIGQADDRVIEKLMELLEDSDVRGIAADALGRIGKADDRVIEKLMELLEDSDMRGIAADALGRISKADDRVIEKLMELLEDSDVRGRAADALGRIGKADDRVIEKLMELLEDSDVRGIAADALGRIGKADDRVIEKLMELLEDSDVRVIAASALVSIGKADNRVIEKLMELLEDSDVRVIAADALGRIGQADDRVIEKMMELLEDSDVRVIAADALVNIGKADNRVIEKMMEMLEDSDVRGRAASALVSIGKADDRVIEKLMELLEDSDVRGRAASALVSIGKADDRVIKKLMGLLSDEDSDVRGIAADALGSIGKADNRVIEKMMELLSDENSNMRGRAASALVSIGKADDRVIEKMMELLEDSDVRGIAADALGSIGEADDRVIKKLMGLLSDEDSDVRGRAAYALGSIGEADDRVIEKLMELLSDEDSDVCGSAAYALGSIGKADDRVIEKLMELLEDSDVRGIAADALGSIGKADDRVIEKLMERLSDKSSYVRGKAASALVSIGVLNNRVLAVLEDICRNYGKYQHQYAPDPESEGNSIPISDLAFWTLWRHVG